ncbi:MAG: DUF1402 family protein [Rhizobiaceae bacterium]|nr:DUF1402 family protein [Rhizobiaceae bacterium]
MACAPLTSGALAATKVKPGNTMAEQPAIPGASVKRTKDLRSSFEKKYAKALNLLKNDGKLTGKIKSVASKYGVDPVHIAGAIVGEHTFNVDAYDRLQTYYVKAVAYLNSDFAFKFEGEKVSEFVNRPQFEPCSSKTSSYDLWICRERIWDSAFRGKTVDDVRYPKQRFGQVFFQPYYAGQTFGIGQLNPLTALQMSDKVNSVSGLPKLDAKNARKVYETIMDPDLTLPYIAAVIRTSIDAYKSIAGFDISANPGLTATLYNLGDPVGRAQALKRRGGVPEVNYYGWFVNEKQADLEALF